MLTWSKAHSSLRQLLRRCVQRRMGVAAKCWMVFKSAPRRSLDPRFRYIRPGCDPDGQEGVDFLLGEASVLQYTAAMTGPQRESGGGRGSGRSSHTGGRMSAATRKGAATRKWLAGFRVCFVVLTFIEVTGDTEDWRRCYRGRGRGRGRGLGPDAGRGDASTAVPGRADTHVQY
ncbi:hypothetical protein GQ600_3977 [Phytophthora cactorum]|nr:hypothetical protein GQ600_3977 [Phytophthora cactorum]